MISRMVDVFLTSILLPSDVVLPSPDFIRLMLEPWSVCYDIFLLQS
jgi:hypothetical protein